MRPGTRSARRSAAAVPQELQERREAAGYDRPLIVQYGEYLGQVARLDFGETIVDHRPVTDVIRENGAATLELTVAAFLVAVIVGVAVGLLAGRYRDSALDVSGRLFGIVIYAFPVFFLGYLAQLIFSQWLGWLPSSGRASPIVQIELSQYTNLFVLDSLLTLNFDALQDVLAHLILPATTLGLVTAGVIIRLVRVNLLQTLRGDYVEAARAREIGERNVVVRHAFKNALVPVITVMGLQVALLLGGGTHGADVQLARDRVELVRYLDNRDYIAVQGIITFFALVVIAVSVLIDFINAWVDPRCATDAPKSPHNRHNPARKSRLRSRRVAGGTRLPTQVGSSDGWWSGARPPSPCWPRSERGRLMARAVESLPRASRSGVGARIGRMVAPIREARGVPKWVVWAGILITLFFVVLALFAPWIAPYDFDTYRNADGVRFVASSAVVEHWFGTNVQSTDVLSAWSGARGLRSRSSCWRSSSRWRSASARPGFRLLRRPARPDPAADQRCVIRDLRPARDRDRFFALRQARPGRDQRRSRDLVVYIPQYYRVVRNHVISIREPYVEAARAMGAKPRTIIGRYVFNNVVQSVPVIATLNAADAILTLAALGFLGYGIQPTEAAEWGYDLSARSPTQAPASGGRASSPASRSCCS